MYELPQERNRLACEQAHNLENARIWKTPANEARRMDGSGKVVSILHKIKQRRMISGGIFTGANYLIPFTSCGA